MNKIEFNWNTKPQDSIFTNGIPTKEDIKKYGILNIIDYHFDGTNKTPYELDNKSSDVLNSFLLNAWDFLRNIDKTLVDSYYGAACDAANYLLALSRFKKRRHYLVNVSTKNKQRCLNESIDQLYNYYLNRKNFYLKNKIDQRFGYENNYKINIYIVQGSQYLQLKDGVKYDTNIIDKETQSYFEYYIESDFYVDLYNEPCSNLFILFELFDAIRKALESYKENKYQNIYEEYLKLYFYKRLTEKYRTKEIEDEVITLIKNKDFDQAKIIPTLYGRLNGKNGILKAPNITETTKNFSENIFTLPFYRSTVNNNNVSFYIDKWKLPASFGAVKKYTSVKNYISKDTDFYKRIFNDAKALVVDENIGLTFSDDNLYGLARDYVNENINYLTDLKIAELTSLIRPCFDKEYANLNEDTKYNLNILIKQLSNDFKVSNILFGEEEYDGEIHYFARFIIEINSDLNTNIGSGYLNVQQKTVYGRDNQVTNFVTNNINELKVFDGKDVTKYFDDDISIQIQNTKNKDKFEYFRDYEEPEEFKTALDDKEISILHINKDYEMPYYKTAKITTDGYKYYLDVSNFYLYNRVENIKQICVLDNETKNEYIFNISGFKESVSFEQDACLLFSNNTTIDGNYIFDDTLYVHIINGINNGDLKVEKDANGNNEIVIQSESAGISTIVGDTFVIGKEYKASIIDGKQQYVKVTLEDDGDYCLELISKNDDNKIEIVDSYEFVVNKQLIIDKTNFVEEYLNTIPIGGDGVVVFILSFIQQNYGTAVAYLDDYINKKPAIDNDGASYSWEIVNYEFKS